MLSGKLQRIICAVTDIGIDKLFIFTVGGKGWIHAVPFLPVIGNRLFHPSFSTYVNIDPGMLDVTYDEDKAATVETGYLPDIDETLSTGKGICFDYAGLHTGKRCQCFPVPWHPLPEEKEPACKLLSPG